MQNMKSGKTTKICILVLCTALIASCQAKPTFPATQDYSAGELTPYYTATSIPTFTATPENAPTATPQPTLTPTPRAYVLKEGDTLWTIAALNGLSPAELQAANPGLDPYTLRSGMTIYIPAPAGSNQTQTAPTPTAVAVNIHSAECTPSLTGGLYCFAIVDNQQGFDIQNLIVQFSLTDPETGDKYIQEGLMPLNRLVSGTSLPLFAYFTPPAPVAPEIEVQLLSAMPISEDDKDFLDLVIENPQTTISSDGYSAQITGSVTLSNSKKSASQFWIAAVAYDDAGKVVAVRQLNKQVDLSGGISVDFTINVYSIAGKIDHVDLFGEAAP
jgi:murein DD-endopeptidase MepM/ murein hydrolase activator NlpD